MESQYRWQSWVYDLSRWAFLFGRDASLRAICERRDPRSILEVGCGTGRNLSVLARALPSARLVGVDASESMLARARRKLRRFVPKPELVHAVHPERGGAPATYDAVLLSYSLSMMNPGRDEAIAAAIGQLRSGGLLVVVDFHDSPVAAVRRWMRWNHVQMEGDLLPRLRSLLPEHDVSLRKAFLGAWSYFVFAGRK